MAAHDCDAAIPIILSPVCSSPSGRESALLKVIVLHELPWYPVHWCFLPNTEKKRGGKSSTEEDKTGRSIALVQHGLFAKMHVREALCTASRVCKESDIVVREHIKG